MWHDDEWGRDSLKSENTLYIYRPDGEKEKRFAEVLGAKRHEGRLFVHDVCYGQRYTYTIEHVNRILTDEENPDSIKERIVDLLPHLAENQKQWVAEGISDAGLAIVGSVNPQTAAEITRRQQSLSGYAR